MTNYLGCFVNNRVERVLSFLFSRKDANTSRRREVFTTRAFVWPKMYNNPKINIETEGKACQGSHVYNNFFSVARGMRMWIFLPNNSSFHLELKFIFHITIFVKFSSQKPKIPHLQNSSFFLLTHTTYKIFKNNSYFICGENIYSFVIEFSSCGNIKSIADNIEVYDEKTFALRTFFLLFS